LYALPRLYAIADRETLDARGISLEAFARELHAAGVTLVQYRDKRSAPHEILRATAIIRTILASHLTPETSNLDQAKLILNDRADLAALAGWGLHVGQGDLTPGDARKVIGASQILGVSTHSDEQVREADATDADYIAIGPVFSTITKLDAENPVGLEGVRRRPSHSSPSAASRLRTRRVSSTPVQIRSPSSADSWCRDAACVRSPKSFLSVWADNARRQTSPAFVTAA
jgi:thiamine-phosphate pyrophosphorylase